MCSRLSELPDIRKHYGSFHEFAQGLHGDTATVLEAWYQQSNPVLVKDPCASIFDSSLVSFTANAFVKGHQFLQTACLEECARPYLLTRRRPVVLL